MVLHLGYEYISGAGSVFFYCWKPAGAVAVAVWSATASCHARMQLALVTMDHGVMGMVDEVYNWNKHPVAQHGIDQPGKPEARLPQQPRDFLFVEDGELAEGI
jgi:hypothetical protein